MGKGVVSTNIFDVQYSDRQFCRRTKQNRLFHFFEVLGKLFFKFCRRAGRHLLVDEEAQRNSFFSTVHYEFSRRSARCSGRLGLVDFLHNVDWRLPLWWRLVTGMLGLLLKWKVIVVSLLRFRIYV